MVHNHELKHLLASHAQHIAVDCPGSIQHLTRPPVHFKAEMDSSRSLVQGTKVSKYVELDFDEIVCRKALTVESKPALKRVLEEDNEASFDRSNGSITSKEYSLYAADLRDLRQVIFCLLSQPLSQTAVIIAPALSLAAQLL